MESVGGAAVPGICRVLTVDLVERLDEATSESAAKQQLRSKLEDGGWRFVQWLSWRTSQVMMADGLYGMRFIGTARVR